MNGGANKKGVFFGVLLIVGGLIGVVFGLNYLADANRSKTWQATEGVTVSAGVIGHAKNSGSSGSYSVDVRYTYQVDGQTYQSDRIAFNGARQYNSKSKAQTAIADYSAGNVITVYYNPDDPAISVLQPGSSWQAYRPLGFAVLAIILGAFLVRDQMAIKEE